MQLDDSTSPQRVPELMKVDICVATFKRPHLLARLVESIHSQTALSSINELIIVDNDCSLSAMNEVSRLSRMYSALAIRYVSEPVQGIAQARNAAIEASTSAALVFIDDDEIATPGWLESLLHAQKSFSADIVFGAVRAILPDDTPDWIRNGNYFDNACFETGTPRQHGATNNVLISRRVISDAGRLFDTSFGKTGGEDTEYFSFLFHQGVKMIFCNEALVYDPIPANRTTYRWLRRRFFRSGQTLSRVALRHQSCVKVAFSSVVRICYMAFLVVTALFLALFSPQKAKRMWLECIKHSGYVSGFFGGRFEEYS